MFYLINKPIWITSFWVLKVLRKKFNLKKIWHTGTLDPLATWLLLVATLGSTKLIPYLEKKEKTYVFSFNIDWYSPTWDLEWEIIYFDKKILEEKRKVITKELIEKTIKEKFCWIITQTPPKYSAIKIDWIRAYESARKWEEIIIKEREIEIFDIKLTEYKFPKITIEATVSAGTYIRVIAENIWKELWLNWYVTHLHRSRIWTIWEELSYNLDNIEIPQYINEEVLFPEFSKIEVSEKELIDIKNWKEIIIDWTIEWKKYFVTHQNIIESLVEIRDSKARILRNWLS